MAEKAQVELSVRNGNVDFLLFPQGADDQKKEVRVQNGTVWLNRAGMAVLLGSTFITSNSKSF